MKKEFLDALYERREFVRRRKTEHAERKTFDGNEGSCDYPIHKMQEAEIAHQLQMLDETISEYLRIHSGT